MATQMWAEYTGVSGRCNPPGRRHNFGNFKRDGMGPETEKGAEFSLSLRGIGCSRENRVIGEGKKKKGITCVTNQG